MCTRQIFYPPWVRLTPSSNAGKTVQRIWDYLKVQPDDGELMRLHAMEAELNSLGRLFDEPLEKCMGRLRVYVMPLYESWEDYFSRLFLARPRVLVAAR